MARSGAAGTRDPARKGSDAEIKGDRQVMRLLRPAFLAALAVVMATPAVAAIWYEDCQKVERALRAQRENPVGHEIHLTLGLGFVMKRVKLNLVADLVQIDNEFLTSFIYQFK